MFRYWGQIFLTKLVTNNFRLTFQRPLCQCFIKSIQSIPLQWRIIHCPEILNRMLLYHHMESLQRRWCVDSLYIENFQGPNQTGYPDIAIPIRRQRLWETTSYVTFRAGYLIGYIRNPVLMHFVFFLSIQWLVSFAFWEPVTNLELINGWLHVVNKLNLNALLFGIV
jgi:hypothetical protein